MTHGSFYRSMAGLVVALGITACSTTPRVEPDSEERAAIYEMRLFELGGRSEWALAGRLAVNSGKDGGSGTFNWSEQTEVRRMDFHGALGRGAWRLAADAAGAVLELADGEVYRARTVGELVEQRLGWEIPVEALAWWVRGLAAPGARQVFELDERGLLTELSQHGWEIQYGRYTDSEAVEMPLKMTARRESQTVKLAVRDWTLGPRAAPDE